MMCPDETTVTLFLERRLARDRSAFIESHIDGCSRCRRLLSALARGSTPATDDATGRIDRYVVRREIGAGGMGTVYAAFDPLLDRTVALKLLHRDRTDTAEGRSRLIREAQAMAKVSSPNVIAVFDAGSFDGQIYIAMELVAGGTLRAWLRERRRPWRDVLRVMIQAGRGLAAAHAAGLVHRDFKPDNVLIDGERVRVADFGLARVGDGTAETAGETGQRTGVAGTPAYMAPEQLAGEPATAASDQFSYCVVLHEALFGERPFAGATVAELAAKIRAGIMQGPTDPAVPAWLRAAVLRGLAVDPGARHRAMDALLGELDRRRSPVRWLAGGGALAIAGAFAAWRLVAAPTGPAPCEGFDRELDGVWDTSRRQAVEAAFAATAVGYARETAGELARTLDDYARAWVAGRVDACRATQRGEQSERVLDQRMRCLDRRSDALGALVGELAAPDPGAIAKAVYAAHALDPIAECSAAAVAVVPAPPLDARLVPWERRLAAARSDMALARYGRAETMAAAVAAEATSAGVKPVVAQALLIEARAVERSGDLPRADALYRDAAHAAEATRLDAVAASARIDRIRVAVDRAKYDDAREMILAATAAAERIDAPPDTARGLATAEGIALAAQGKYEPARARFQAALDVALRSTSDELEIARCQNNVAATLNQLGRYRDAERALAAIVDIRRRALGGHHPDVASAEINLAHAVEDQGRHGDAQQLLDDAVAIARSALGPDHHMVATGLTELATVHLELGHLDRALEAARDALAIEDRHGGRAAALIHNQLGDILDASGRRREALGEYRISLELREKLLGPDHPDLGQSLNNIGATLFALGRHREALAAFEHAIAIKTKALGPDHVRLAPSLLGIGQVHLERNEPAAALAPLERACKLFEPEGDPANLGICRFSLARALWESGRDRARGLALARTARAAIAAGGASARAELTRADAWLAARARKR